MKKTMMAAVAVTTLGLVLACGTDEALDAGSGGSGGSKDAGAETGSGGDSGGAGNSGTGGTAGDANLDASGDAATAAGTLLVAGTDFFSETEVAAFNLDTSQVTGRVSIADGDAVPAASSGRGFVLARTASEVISLDVSGNADKTIDVSRTALGLTGTVPTNPTGIAFVGGDRAWLVLYDANRLAKLDLSTGTVEATLDLSSYMLSGDADASVDAGNAVFDSTNDTLYFTLARVDRTTVTPPSFQLACGSSPALLLGLNTKTGSLRDLNGAAPGEGIALALSNPVDMSLDTAGKRLLVLHAGCFAGADGSVARQAYGVEAVALPGLVVTALFKPTSGDFLSRLLLLSGADAIINRFDSTFSEYWSSWTTTSTNLGSDLSAVPAAAVVEDAEHLLGMTITTTDGGSSAEIQRYAVATQSATVLSTNPWLKNHGFVAGNALVR
ncbi:MAG TPA: hypothetical protein PKA88_00485 [Polyangiaceae bacterium]|nr:hypothetical protein [Polyangiaceae bacterium]